MTYWPISAPSVFAASKHQLPRECHSITDDGTRQATRSSTSRKNGSASPGVGGDGPKGAKEAAEDNAPEPPSSSEGEKKRNNAAASSPFGHVDNGDGDGDDEIELNNEIAGEIIGLRVTRSGSMFATITRTTLTIWQTKPTVILASVLRSDQSLKTYGPNVNLLLRPDSAIFVVQTSLGFLITYSLAMDPSSRVYKPHYSVAGGQSRRHSVNGYKNLHSLEPSVGPGEGDGAREVSLRFRMVIRVDAGIGKALALDDELVVATERPAAIQCIRWAPDSAGSQTSTELLSRMQWLGKKTNILDMVHDRPMNLSSWVTGDGKAYAVQRVHDSGQDLEESKKSKPLFKGYAFHVPENEDAFAVKAAINARFSLIAVGCDNGNICVYTARDYMGNIPLSHTLYTSSISSFTGKLTFLSWSPDGYCLFAGYENGWMMWSVYGKALANSFTGNRTLSINNGETWLLGVRDGFWVGGGSQLLILPPGDNRLWVIEMARSAVAGCFSSANVSRSLLQTNSGFMVYRGYDLPDVTAISAEVSHWHHVQVPALYLVNQWPIRSAVISSDGRYVAVAGKRGLAHYSVNSGRWKTFDDPLMENAFTVRGGMCWHQHVLIAATESSEAYQIRVYSRESALDNNQMMHAENLPAPIVLIAPSGDDSLLVYTYENILYHYVINVTNATVSLVQVGQIALHGIVRAPPRVRALSWILPDHQLHNGDPSQDVSVATVLFLVDGKLVLLQPTTTMEGELKYEMRIIAQNVEYYALMRDHPSFNLEVKDESGSPTSPSGLMIGGMEGYQGHDLRDSLWYFDGHDVRVWIDIQDVLATASAELGRDLCATVNMPVDFYPLSALLNKGILFGVETDLVQRRDVNFAFFRFATRTQLFIPPLLRHHLTRFDSPAALHLSHHYAHLVYFPHALEILLHDVLDEEVDSQPPPEQALLPTVLSFLSSFPQYLDIVVQCTRKTEVRSWRTLFEYLPPPQELFEESLRKGSLKTAGGYLLVLHTFEESHASSQQTVRLLRRAKEQQDWDLCKELARFLMALDESGATLREAMSLMELKSPSEEGSFRLQETSLLTPMSSGQNGTGPGRWDRRSSGGSGTGSGSGSSRQAGDYFSGSV